MQIISTIVTDLFLSLVVTVFTCGLPGVGKTFALSWMSEHGYFPLESIVRVDPDYFKLIMPEWKGYQQADVASAASKCHRERFGLCFYFQFN
jgi:hypothetical protein